MKFSFIHLIIIKIRLSCFLNLKLPKNKEGPAGATQQGENLNSNQMDDDDDQLMSNTPAVAIAVGDIGRDDVSGQEAPAKQLDLNQGPSQEARQVKLKFLVFTFYSNKFSQFDLFGSFLGRR